MKCVCVEKFYNATRACGVEKNLTGGSHGLVGQQGGSEMKVQHHSCVVLCVLVHLTVSVRHLQ